MFGWIWRKNMFNEQFNALYVDVKEYALAETVDRIFSDPEKQIKYFESVVDQYNTLLFNLENVKKHFDSDSQTYKDIDFSIKELNDTFEKYDKKSVVVRSYWHELNSANKKMTFSESLYRFELLFKSSPVIKIDVEEIQTVLSYAKSYVSKTNVFYYYSNNPFEIDDVYGITLPIKNTFDTAEKLLTSLYNYMYSLYKTHLVKNKDELESMVVLEKNIQNKIYEFRDLVNRLNRNKIEIGTDQDKQQVFFDTVNSLEKNIKIHTDSIIELGVFRFTSLGIIFNNVWEDAKKLFINYKSNEIYVAQLDTNLFYEYLDKLGVYITLLEDGKIKLDTDYIITDVSLKELVEKIITLCRIVKKKITYTQKFHDSGYPKMLEFDFYQTELFLESVKKYYYHLMSENVFRYSNISVDEFGDYTVDIARKDFKNKLNSYNLFVKKDLSYLNDFEFIEYHKQLVEIQKKLKNSAVTFYDQSIKTSHATYITFIEKHYSNFLNVLSNDLIEIESKRNIDFVYESNVDKVEARKKLNYINDHISSMSRLLTISNKYVFLGFTTYIDVKIFKPFSDIFSLMKKQFNLGDYKGVLNTYDIFYSQNLVNFNIVYALEKLGELVNEVFMKVDLIDKLYIDEVTSGIVSTSQSDTIQILYDLFDDETFKVSRHEIFSNMDVLYEFIISTRSSEKAYLLNEKNLKKLYFDNQLMKINYIGWYHKILQVETKYKNINVDNIKSHDLFVEKQLVVSGFNHKNRLESLIANQNKNISLITKMIKEYSSDTNFNTVNLSTDIIKNIESYNISILDDFESYENAVDDIENIKRVDTINNMRLVISDKHKKQWVDIIKQNSIDEPETVSYNEMPIFKGSIPYTVKLKAKIEKNVDVSGVEINATYKWFIAGDVFDGNEKTYTFYDEGKHKVRCDIIYPNGEILSRFLEFNLSGPSNKNIIKTENVDYSPINVDTSTPKLTYVDPKTGLLVTTTLNFSGNIGDALDSGNLTFSPDGLLPTDKAGLVILGFLGNQFAGDKFDNSSIFTNDFKYPNTESQEFLFDFKVSAPISGLSSVNIAQSKFIKLMAKVPNTIKNIYAINKASLYDSIGDSVKICVGDKLIFKNIFDRYMVVEVLDLISKSESEKVSATGVGEYDYTIKFRFFVNTSLNQFDRDIFKPTETTLTIPTIIFKSNVRELFASTIERLEKINILREKLNDVLDIETHETIKSEITDLENLNKGFYLFEELDKVKAKKYAMQQLFIDLDNSIKINYDLTSNELKNIIDKYDLHVKSTKIFEVWVNSVFAYDPRKNIIDLGILIDLYNDEESILELIIETYNYKIRSQEYFKNALKNIKLFDTSDYVDIKLPYGEMLVNLVKNLRNLLFQIKLIVNFPIMSKGNHMIFSGIYHRLAYDIFEDTWDKKVENDFFLLYKKIELQYGYEIDKVEVGKPYKEFISDLVSFEKQLFGTGLSVQDKKNISRYIQSVESKAVAAYDDFFMIPLWLDYLKKNV